MIFILFLFYYYDLQSLCYYYYHYWEGVHLTLPSDILFIQVKSLSMLHHRSVEVSLKQNKRNL